MSTTPDFTILDPLAAHLATTVPQGSIFCIRDVCEELTAAGHVFTETQVRSSCDYLRRSYSLVEWTEAVFGRRHTRGSEWFRWVGTAELYAERRRRAGNYLLGCVQGREWDDPTRVAHREMAEASA